MTASASATRTVDAIPEGLWRQFALSDAEYGQIVALLGRTPSLVELGMFGAMWSEHCGYKHSRPLLKNLPTEAAWVVQGPGENAGAVDIGGGLAVVFKVESHNHPSAVEPYEGAATGIGGIVRDIFTMGARPIALLDSLRFGPLTEPRNRYLFSNVVGGVGDYGNCLGIPNVGGEVYFDPSYDGNPLVNAMCLGIVPRDELMRARASGPGNVVMMVGAATGRDGLHGATFASVEDPSGTHRGVVQVGNPFLEKLLLEACLQLLEGDDVVAMQDLGAAGLTSSTVECASRGGVGVDIDVAHVPRREEGLGAFEVMLSESQERMLLVVRPDGVERVSTVVERAGLNAAVIGHVTDTGNVVVREEGVVVCDVPGTLFTDACPTYTPAAAEDPTIAAARATSPYGRLDLSSPEEFASALLTMLASDNIGSRRQVYERYDSTILTSTVVGPGDGDAGVLRLRGHEHGIAVSLDCNSRYCYLDPRAGAALAVAESLRNVSCVGGRPLAITNCLNFRNPEKPAGYHQLSEAVAGITAACEALGVVVVSGNVSLYNETPTGAVFPTPTIGAVGVVDDVTQTATMRWEVGDSIWLLAGGAPTLGASEFVAVMDGATIGEPPMLDLAAEAAVQSVVRGLVQSDGVRTAHDVSLGGVAVALAEMAIRSGVGFELDSSWQNSTKRVDQRWFGERSATIIVAAPTRLDAAVAARSAELGIAATRIGRATGSRLSYGDIGSVDLIDAENRYESALSGS